jgi:hypothetical protein
MQQCLEQAVKLGHTVKWGDSGPRLLTRVLTDYGALNRVVPASVCYPVHYSEALDALRPSKTAVLAPRVETSLFLHVWNSMLVYRGIQKSCLPPRGSLLRGWMDRYPIDGWTGEYDEQTLEGALSLKTQLNACAEENHRLLNAAEENRRLLNACAEENRRLLNACAEESCRLQAALEGQGADRTQLDAILTSTSWRLTAPMRALRRLGRRK